MYAVRTGWVTGVTFHSPSFCVVAVPIFVQVVVFKTIFLASAIVNPLLNVAVPVLCVKLPVKETAPLVVIGYAVPAARSHRLDSTVPKSVVATCWTTGVLLKNQIF